jgi:predicted RNA binding protein YcfA (HicA-like mRNA interferase family)
VTKVSPLRPEEVAKLLERLGFREVRHRGSHKQFRHPDGRGTTVPFHPGRDVSPILIRRIAADIKVPLREFLRRG